MSITIPTKVSELVKLTWSDFEPAFKKLEKTTLTASNVEAWLSEWSRAAEAADEMSQRLYVARTVNTADEVADMGFNDFMDNIYPQLMEANQKLKEKLITSKLEPKGFEIPLRNMHAEFELFRSENLPLLAEEQKFNTQYDKIIGAQAVQWEGQEMTVTQLRPVYFEDDRSRREKAFRTVATRQLADRQVINENWQNVLALRLKIARNAGEPDYRAWKWQDMLRFDYTPEDSKKFQIAIEKAVVPVAKRLYEKRRKRLDLDTLRPWDLDVDPLKRPALHPYKTVEELKSTTSRMYHSVDETLGKNLDYMISHDLMDLENRKNKAPGAYCTNYNLIRKPFIFHNAVGIHDDVQTILHEGGHAMHVFESASLPYVQQLQVPMEFAEVASMAMELLASPYLEKEKGGFYSKKEAAQALGEHLERTINFWPYMAVVDAFQHWVYENPQKALDPANCDTAWGKLWDRFMVGVDWSGLDDYKVTGWQRKLHIHQIPFYYVEYGLAQLGAAQIWVNALKDQKKAVADYRHALSLGSTVTLPELYKAAGVRLAFDAETLDAMVNLMEQKIEELEKV
jgi:oligoendopeptidase F